MHFVSTRGLSDPIDFTTALFSGFAPDGGMYLPQHIPHVDRATLLSWRRLSYPQLLVEILALYITSEHVPKPTLAGLVDKALETFHLSEEYPELCAFRTLSSGLTLCNMHQGPSLAFKDYGVSVLVALLDHFMAERGEVLNLVVATSGDTGPSAIQAVRNHQEHLRLFVLYPIHRVSPVQELQMVSEAVAAPNIHVIAVEDGDSDALDTPLADLFADEDFCKTVQML